MRFVLAFCALRSVVSWRTDTQEIGRCLPAYQTYTKQMKLLHSASLGVGTVHPCRRIVQNNRPNKRSGFYVREIVLLLLSGKRGGLRSS